MGVHDTDQDGGVLAARPQAQEPDAGIPGRVEVRDEIGQEREVFHHNRHRAQRFARDQRERSFRRHVRGDHDAGTIDNNRSGAGVVGPIPGAVAIFHIESDQLAQNALGPLDMIEHVRLRQHPERFRCARTVQPGRPTVDELFHPFGRNGDIVNAVDETIDVVGFQVHGLRPQHFIGIACRRAAAAQRCPQQRDPQHYFGGCDKTVTGRPRALPPDLIWL